MRIILTLAVLFCSFLSLPVFAADLYYVVDGATEAVDEHGVCKDVSNNCGSEIMIPTKTANEWATGGQSFLENLYTGLSVADCSGGGGGQGSCIDAGYTHSCVLKTDGSIACWGADVYGESASPSGTNFIAVAAVGDFYTGDSHSCALKTDGSIVCWGSNTSGQSNAPSGTDFISVATGAYHNCALKTDGSIFCWGDNGGGQLAFPSGTDFTSVDTAAYHSCALKTDGSIACWGDNGGGQSTPPSGTDFETVTLGAYHSCAVKTDGSIVCWGYNWQGETSSPPGSDYVSVSLGFIHNCALKTDGSIFCWGDNTNGEADSPAGTDFTAVVAGGYHNCALKTDGSIFCWGDNSFGQTNSPSGTNYGCSSGGGGDTEPDAFDFTDVADATVSTEYSDSAVVAGFDGPLAASVSGGGAEVRKNGGGTWGASVDVSSGDTLNVRMTSSGSGSTAVQADLTLGTASVDWVVTTEVVACPNIGDVCADGSINAGQSNGIKMYAANVDQSTGTKWSTESVNTGADSVSDGYVNQQWIIDNETLSQYPAFGPCESLNRHGHTDWYLPSKNELNTLYQSKAAIGGFTTMWYWSSTEDDTTDSWYQWFNSGSQGNGTKIGNSDGDVRCVRRELPAECSLPWGGTLAHSAGVTAYQNSSESCGDSCTSETRTCTDGTLSGSYTNQSCSVAACGGTWTSVGTMCVTDPTLPAACSSSTPTGQACSPIADLCSVPSLPPGSVCAFPGSVIYRCQ